MCTTSLATYVVCNECTLCEHTCTYEIPLCVLLLSPDSANLAVIRKIHQIFSSEYLRLFYRGSYSLALLLGIFTTPHIRIERGLNDPLYKDGSIYWTENGRSHQCVYIRIVLDDTSYRNIRNNRDFEENRVFFLLNCAHRPRDERVTKCNMGLYVFRVFYFFFLRPLISFCAVLRFWIFIFHFALERRQPCFQARRTAQNKFWR